MRSARTLIGIVAATLVAGCSGPNGRWGLVRKPAGTEEAQVQPASESPAAQPSTTQPAASPPAATQPEAATRPADNLAQDELGTLNDQVASYLQRIQSSPAGEHAETAEPAPLPASRPAQATRIIAPEPRSEVVASPSPASIRAVPSPAAEPPLPARSRLPESAAPTMAVLPTPASRPALAVNVAAQPLGIEILEVRAAQANVPTPAVGSAAQPEGAPNHPVAAAVPTGASLDGLIASLRDRMSGQPPQVQDEFRLRLLYLAAGKTQEATTPGEHMDPVQAELIGATFKAFSAARQALLEPDKGGGSALAYVSELQRLLGQQLGVTIPRMALVTRVTSFGDYEAIAPLRFKAGQELHAYVYTEVANFRSEPADDGRIRTLLSEKVEVFDAAGTCVFERVEPNIEDRVRSPRRDFFIPFPVQLPARLAPGEYVLKVTIEDRIGATTDQQRLSFAIYQ